MAKILINITDEEYEYFKALKEYGYGTMFNGLAERVANGVVLPKGHGRLIDADKLKDQIIEVKLENVARDIRVITGCQLEESPTIIEADKE